MKKVLIVLLSVFFTFSLFAGCAKKMTDQEILAEREAEREATFAEFQWPDSEIASLLPVPESNIGSIEWEASYGFVIYVGETSKEQYDTYVEECRKKGFTVDYEKYDGFYFAHNEAGYVLYLEYEDNNSMFVSIDEPVDEEDTSAVEETTEAPTETSIEAATETSTEAPTATPMPTPTETSTEAPTVTPMPTPTVAGPTTGESNALRSAKAYLDYMAFSYSGLVDQLEYEGYTNKEAAYGVDNCGANWNTQAVKSAKTYLDYMAFSYSGLVDQLEYEGYTNNEATYGVDNCGANWDTQAAKSAKTYLDYMAFSRQGLIDQLEYDGYTHSQAVYGVEANGL